MPLLALAELVVQRSDRVALGEIHQHRRVFRAEDGTPLRLVEYVDELSRGPRVRRWVDYNSVVLEQARDLTVDKFSNLPLGDQNPSRQEASQLKRKGPDCRLYFMAFLKHMSKQANGRHDASPMAEERRASRALQVLVYRHFGLACLECARRSNPLVRRFFWKVNGRALCLWLPSCMSGRECRAWLEKHVDRPDPLRSGERNRIQDLINKRLVLPRLVSLNGRTDLRAGGPASLPSLPSSVLHEMSAEGLAELVAQEKAEAIEQQRRTIRAMGSQKLKALIRRVFEDLSGGVCEDGKVAGDFGLGQATFSRFAGRRWSDRPGGSPAVPDLWRNTAHTLARVPAFVEAAKDAGVWSRVEAICERSYEVRTPRDD